MPLTIWDEQNPIPDPPSAVLYRLFLRDPDTVVLATVDSTGVLLKELLVLKQEGVMMKSDMRVVTNDGYKLDIAGSRPSTHTKDLDKMRGVKIC